MRRWLKRIGFALALMFVGLTVYNASWLAAAPQGGVKLVAHRGLYQAYDHTDLGRDDCTATRIEQPVHGFLENTVPSIREAGRTGAVMVEVDIAPTSDGEIVLFHDWTADCRTNASGDTRGFTLAELKELDAGYGYTADGGKTFPFRGKHIGAIPTLAEGIAAAPRGRFIFNFKSKDAGEADLLAAKLEEAGRRIDYNKDAFYGADAPVRRIKELYPDAWAFSQQGAKQCSKDYALVGWFGVIPDSCRASGTIFVALDYQWVMPGWPNRMIQRMQDAGVEIIMIGPVGPDNAPRGIDLPEQLGDVPSTFNGWLWVDDMYAVGPALRPDFNTRTELEEEQLAQALERRRQARD